MAGWIFILFAESYWKTSQVLVTKRSSKWKIKEISWNSKMFKCWFVHEDYVDKRLPWFCFVLFISFKKTCQFKVMIRHDSSFSSIMDGLHFKKGNNVLHNVRFLLGNAFCFCHLLFRSCLEIAKKNKNL